MYKYVQGQREKDLAAEKKLQLPSALSLYWQGSASFLPVEKVLTRSRRNKRII